MMQQSAPSRCSSVALYGCESVLTARGWFDVAERYFAYLEVKPNQCTLSLKSEPGRARALKWDTARRRAEAGLDLEVVSARVLLPGAQDSMFWQACATWSTPVHSSVPDVYFGYREDIGPFSSDSCEHVARLVTDRHPVGYGICYERDARLGPEAYAIGMQMGYGRTQPDEIEAKRIALFGREFYAPRPDEPERFRHLAGMLRDSYAISVLSEKHLAVSVRGQSLKEWIASDRRHGTLNQIGARNWLWLVDADNQELVRNELAAAQLIIVLPPA